MTTASLFSPAVERILNDVSLRSPITPKSDVEAFIKFVKHRAKIETHVHVEAAVAASYYAARCHDRQWNERPPWKRAPFADFRSFITAWVDLTKCVRSLEELEVLAQMFVESRVSENIRYTEAYFSPADFSLLRHRFKILPEVFDFYDVVSAYVRGLRKGIRKSPGFEVRLILDSFWPSTQTEKIAILEGLRKAKADALFYDEEGVPYIVAVGFGGSEQPENIDATADFVAEVRACGYKIDIHSGEGGEPERHRSHVERLVPDRVSHGFSAVEQGWYFQENLVMCPISNLLLKTFCGSAENHPVFELLRRGEALAIGTDDPLLLGHSLTEEFAFLFAVDSQLSEVVFDKIQADTKDRVLCPQVCRRVL